jgi:hypothetical protein
MAVAVFMIIFWLGFERFDAKPFLLRKAIQRSKYF